MVGTQEIVECALAPIGRRQAKSGVKVPRRHVGLAVLDARDDLRAQRLRAHECGLRNIPVMRE
jgi:hypothetical protein